MRDPSHHGAGWLEPLVPQMQDECILDCKLSGYHQDRVRILQEANLRDEFQYQPEYGLEMQWGVASKEVHSDKLEFSIGDRKDTR
jgi:hypothetical protein